MADSHIADGLDAEGNLLVSHSRSQSENEVQNTIASAQHSQDVGNKNNNVLQDVANVGEQQSDVHGHGNEENHDAIGIHPNLPLNILAVDLMSQEELVAALEVLSDTNLPAEAVCIDVEIVEAIVAATVTFLHHHHTQCIRVNELTDERCTAHA